MQRGIIIAAYSMIIASICWLGCSTSSTVKSNRTYLPYDKLTLAEAESKTVSIIVDQSKADGMLLVDPLKQQLINKGYQIVPEGSKAAYTLQLDMKHLD